MILPRRNFLALAGAAAVAPLPWFRRARHGAAWGMALTLILLTGTCSEGSFVSPDGHLVLGTWGGDNAGVIATDSVTHIHIGCSFGDIPGRLAVAPDGHFTAEGSYVLRAYPIMVGPSLPAQFTGRVSGRTLTLAVAVNDTVEKKPVALGPVSVVYGRSPNLGPCPICLVPRLNPQFIK